ncbi:MAG TPA: STAS domain-containing protein [Gemmataceae bacterium]|jgi:anti-anti-sigma factor|nr:STAS domain-containing protein [Gemmataceae bacterium]
MSSQRGQQFLQVAAAGDVMVVTFTDKILDEANIQAIGGELSRLVDRLADRRLHLDLAKVRFLSSTWLGKFITILKSLRAAGGQLTLYNTDAQIYEVFEVTRLTQLLDIRRGPA